MAKKNYAYGGKATAILEWLNTEPTASDQHIAKHVQCSASYVHKMRKLMAHVPETPKPGEFIETDTNVDKILNKRAEQYGSFMRSSDAAIKIKQVVHNTMVRENTQLFPDQLQALDMIATKIGRILTGNPSHLDSWVDIAGYAQLVADRLQGKVR